MSMSGSLVTWGLVSVGLACAAAGAEASGEVVPLPPESAYVRVDSDGHLSIGGERRRFWAAIGQVYAVADLRPDDSAAVRSAKVAAARARTDALLARLEALGFNSFRIFDAPAGPYMRGDGSRTDALDYFLAEAGRRGFRVWNAACNRAGVARPDDVSVIDDPATAEAWQSAVAAERSVNLARYLATVWDPRLEALRLQANASMASHRNEHNGLRWADDPVFGVWELSNEEWWMRRMVRGGWQSLPEYFQATLQMRWHRYLEDKYGDEAALARAWGGLLPGESLASGTVAIAPLADPDRTSVALNDANPLAHRSVAGAGPAAEDVDAASERHGFERARGEDVIAFFLELQLAHKRRLHEALRPLGRSTLLAPWVYDTGIGYEVQSQYLQQSADAVAHDAYTNGWGPRYRAPDPAAAATPHLANVALLGAERAAANDGPWVNWLLKPPGLAQGVPWLEHNRVEGKPFLAYETQIQQPAKYRADYPLRVAALAAIQDWDWICWHYFAATSDDGPADRPWDRALDVTTGRHPQGYHYTYDEVQNATMRSAATLFRDGLLQPAPSPTVFVYGRRTLLDPASMDYAGSYGAAGLDMLQTVYEHGVRIRIDPTREDDAVLGPVVPFAARHTHNPYTPTNEITFDWRAGNLRFDAPGAMAFAGLLGRAGGRWEFGHGVTLRDVTWSNPDGTFSPIDPAEGYLAFSLQSMDGRSLAESRRASLVLVSTSFNTGFEAALDDPRGLGWRDGRVKGGTRPVLVTRVGATVEGAALVGMRWTMRDWHFVEVARGTVGPDGVLVVPADLPVFVVDMER